jgi:HSP20 family molecular chaperone IbpA
VKQIERGERHEQHVDAAEVKAKHANGMLEVRVAAPRAAKPKMIEVTAN